MGNDLGRRARRPRLLRRSDEAGAAAGRDADEGAGRNAAPPARRGEPRPGQAAGPGARHAVGARPHARLFRGRRRLPRKARAELQGRVTMDERQLAAKVGAAMYAADRASREFMQMELLGCEPGRAVMRMAVRPEMLNGHEICHGGLIFTLADSTLAFA